MKIMLIVFGENCNSEREHFYDVLKWASKMDYDKILVIDKFYNQASDETTFGVKYMKSIDFQTKPNVHYSLVLNFDNKKGIARTLNRIKNGNVSFDMGLIQHGKYKPIAH